MTALEAMLESESQPPSEISVLITDSEEIRELNRRFRGIDEPTDVLSFPEDRASPNAANFLGDVAISFPIAEEQARSHGTPVGTELACLAVHGGLHLLGYLHDDEAAFETMNRKTKEAVRAAGMEPVYEWGSLPH